jgi:hypothetical protein
MTKRMAVVLASCLALAACGGNSGGNAAAGKTFSYGAPQGVDPTAASSVATNALTVKTAPDTTGVQVLAGGASSGLLPASGVSLIAAGPEQQRALAAGRSAALSQLGPTAVTSFDNQATCVTSSATQVAMTGCTITIVDVSMTAKVQVDGSLAYDAALGKLNWDLTLVSNMTFSSMTPAGTATVRFHESGALTVTDTTIKGDLLAELGMNASAQGQSVSLGVDEAVILDVTYAGTPACVTGGTLEAKRVWTQRPSGASGLQYADVGAKVTWTGCGQATAVYSWM